jgi:hypothetical protein
MCTLDLLYLRIWESTNWLICLSPINKFGSWCLLTHSTCQWSNINLYLLKRFQWTSMLVKQYGINFKRYIIRKMKFSNLIYLLSLSLWHSCSLIFAFVTLGITFVICVKKNGEKVRSQRQKSFILYIFIIRQQDFQVLLQMIIKDVNIDSELLLLVN